MNIDSSRALHIMESSLSLSLSSFTSSIYVNKSISCKLQVANVINRHGNMEF
uniref:Pyruvate kinase, cytosolic isozyme n=1 Tax=Arundo donax TaxID=35708 RepID=A0A0A9H6N4_ARUDO